MVHWKALLSDGDIAEEGVGSWVEIPEKNLPWRRLCEQLAETNDWIEKLSIVTYSDTTEISNPIDEKPLYYSIQVDLIVKDIMSGASMESFLNVAAHYDDYTLHFIFDENSLVRTYSDNDYEPLVPSPRRKNV